MITDSRGEHFPRRVFLVGTDDRVEEVDDILMFLVFRAIAGDIKGRRASSVLRELQMVVRTVRMLHHERTCLVGPEVRVGRTLVNPILVH